jgi:hypothetical protein
LFHETRDAALKSEILRALAGIRPNDKDLRLLAVDILKREPVDVKLREEAVMLLAVTGRFGEVARNVSSLTPEMAERLQNFALSPECRISAEITQYFIQHQENLLARGKANTALLYALRPGGPKAATLKKLLQFLDEDGIKTVCQGIAEKFPGKSSEPLVIFRALAELPYYSQDCEERLGNALGLIVKHVRKVDILLYNELCRLVMAILHSVLSKSLKNFILSREKTSGTDASMTPLSDFLQIYANPDQIKELKRIFSLEDGGEIAKSFIAKLAEILPDTEKAELLKTTALIDTSTTAGRFVMNKLLEGVDSGRAVLLRRVNRMVRLAGQAGARQSVSQVLAVLNFARENKIAFLTESSIVTLCQLHDRLTIEGAPFYLSDKTAPNPVINGLLRGLRYLPASGYANYLFMRILDPETPAYSFGVAVDSFFSMEGEKTASLPEKLFSRFDPSRLGPEEKKRVARNFAMALEPSCLSQLIEKSSHGDTLFYLDIADGLTSRFDLHLNSDLVRHCTRLLEHPDPEIRLKVLRILLVLDDESGAAFLAQNLASADRERTKKLLGALENVYTNRSVLIVARFLYEASDERSDDVYEYLHKCLKGPFGRILLSRLCAMMELPEAGLKLSQNSEPELENYNGYLLCVCVDSFARILAESSTEKIAGIMDGLREFVRGYVPAGMNRIYKDAYGMVYLVFESGLSALQCAHKILNDYPKSQWAVQSGIHLKFIIDWGKILVLDGQCAGALVTRILSIIALAGRGDILLTEHAASGMEGLIKLYRYGQVVDPATQGFLALFLFVDFYIRDEQLASALDLTGEDQEGGLQSSIRAVFSRELFIADGSERTAIVRLWQKISLLLTQDGFFTGK